MKNISENRNSYDARFADTLGGEEYDDLLIALEFYDEFQAETGKALKEYIQARCSNQKEIRVLEAGPGTGITTFQILKADPRVLVVSVDNEKKMLDAVRNRFAEVSELKGRADFILSDILKFLESCPDERFDAFASVYTLHNFTTDFRKKVIGLIAKKLKKGGIFINGDKYAEAEDPHKKDLAAEIMNYDKFDIAALKAEKEGNMKRAEHLRTIKKEWIAHTWEDEKNKITAEEQNEIFNELGFIDVKWMRRFDLVTTVSAIKK